MRQDMKEKKKSSGLTIMVQCRCDLQSKLQCKLQSKTIL